MAPHFSTLARKIPWMEEPGRLQSMGSLPRGGLRGQDDSLNKGLKRSGWLGSVQEPGVAGLKALEMLWEERG